MNTIYLRHNVHGLISEIKLNAVPLVGDLIAIADDSKETCFVKVVSRMFHFNTNNPTYDALVSVNVEDSNATFPYKKLTAAEIEELDLLHETSDVNGGYDPSQDPDSKYYADRSHTELLDRGFSLPKSNAA